MVNVDHPPGHVNGRLFSDADHPTVLRTEFDVQEYLAQARGRIVVDAAALTAEAADLDDALVRDLGFLWRLEASALAETRALLASWTSNEARITAFVTAWGYERYWLARALREILDARTARVRPAPGARSWLTRGREIYVERFLPLLAPVLGGAIKEPLTAGHMARLAVTEGALQVAQRALLPRVSGEVARVLAEVADRRGAIVEFFRAEARARITRSPAEAVSARAHLARPWAPMRIVGVPVEDEIAALNSIFDAVEDRAALIAGDAIIGDLLPRRPRPAYAQVLRAHRAWLRRNRPGPGVNRLGDDNPRPHPSDDTEVSESTDNGRPGLRLHSDTTRSPRSWDEHDVARPDDVERLDVSEPRRR